MNDDDKIQLLLQRILGKEIYSELVDYTIKETEKIKGDISVTKAAKIAIINHRMIFILGLVDKISKDNPEVFQTMYEQISNSIYREFLLTPNVEEFIKMYDRYIKLIKEYIEKNP